MAYLGGKSKSAEHILNILNHKIFDSMDYIEPFCGYCHILRRVTNKKTYTASDNNEYLLVLLKHIQKTKNKHPTITQEEYQELRENPKKNKLRAAYAAFCYSYNGKFFGGYVETYQNRNYPEERKRYYDQLHDNATFKATNFFYRDYTYYKGVKNKLIYCDPPYAGTTEYHSGFDNAAFWEFIRTLSKHNYVFVSEYTAPSDFTCITQKTKRNSVAGRGATRKRMEKVFVHSSRLQDPKLKQLLDKNPYACSKKAGKTRKRSRT
jgi:DNA adenine methylase